LSIPGYFGLEIDSHGGHCCGVTHLSHFPTTPAGTTDVQRIAYIRQGIEEVLDDQDIESCDPDECASLCAGCESFEDKRKSHRHCIEVVITTAQAREWRGPLETVGFKEVYSFHNSNSNNACHVFMFTTGEG
jgi:hypothetical protein